MNRLFFALIGLGICSGISAQAAVSQYPQQLICDCCVEEKCPPKECCDPCDPCCECGYFYLGIIAGANFLHVGHTDGNKIDAETGYLVGTMLGYRWVNHYWLENFRLEEEFVYRNNGVNKFGGHNAHHCGTSSISSYSFLTNLIYDISCLEWCCITPYVGAGIGYTYQSIKPSHFNRHEGGFGWQVIAGFETDFWDCFLFGIDYRFHKGPIHQLADHALNFTFTYTF